MNEQEERTPLPEEERNETVRIPDTEADKAADTAPAETAEADIVPDQADTAEKPLMTENTAQSSGEPPAASETDAEEPAEGSAPASPAEEAPVPEPSAPIGDKVYLSEQKLLRNEPIPEDVFAPRHAAEAPAPQPAEKPETAPDPAPARPSYEGGYYSRAYAPDARPTEQPRMPDPAVEKARRKAEKKAAKKAAKRNGIGVGRTLLLLLLCLAVSVGGGIGGSLLARELVPEKPREEQPEHRDDPQTKDTDVKEPVKKPEDTSPTGSKLTEADTQDRKTLSIKQIASQNADSVVEINTSYTEHYYYIDIPQEGAGSGVILTEDGYIVTNYHVVQDAETIHARLHNGDWYEAALIGADEENDVAVLKIDASGLTPAAIGDSSKIEVGDLCVAIGNPLGTLGGSVTDGIISALSREVSFSDGLTLNLFQHSAAISPGNSGGGLFNENGDLIGIVNAKSVASYSEGIGFAIPINSVRSIIEDLITDGYVHGRFTLGVTIVNIDTNRSAMYYGVSEFGIYISEITEKSNAERAGLAVGDLIVSLNGKEVSKNEDVVGVVSDSQVGDVLHFVIKRDGKEMSIDVTLLEDIPESIGDNQI